MDSSRSTLIFLSIPLILIIAHGTGVLRPLEHGISKFALPIEGVFFRSGINIRSFLQGRSLKKNEKNELIKLREEITRLSSEAARGNELEIEVRELRGLLNFQKRSGAVTIVANVVGSRDIGDARTILIDRGFSDGISKNFSVVNQDGILVGKIFDVKEKSSLVLIILDRRSRVAATIQNKDGTIGIVEGGYGLSSSMKFIPLSEKINVGNLVVTSGLEETVPRGLLIGTIESVINDVRDPFQEATIKPLVDFEKLITVAVILPSI